MDRSALVKTTRTLMNQHGLETWKITVSRSKYAAGRCFFLRRIIEVSMPCAETRSESETIDTILHEIAHALTPGHHHDEVWRRKHIEIGGSGRSQWRNDEAVKQMALWVGTCPNGHTLIRNARSEKMRRVSCSLCSPRWDARFMYTWMNKKTGEVVYPIPIAGIAAQTRVHAVAADTMRRPSVATMPQTRAERLPAQICDRCFMQIAPGEIHDC